MTGSGAALGAINAFGFVPSLILSPLSGAAADRFDRKNLMIYTQLLLLIPSLTLGVMFVLDAVNIWILMAFAFLSGIPLAMTQPIRSAVVPMLVPREALPNAAALNSGAFVISRLVGPSLAGLLIVIVGAGANFFIQSVAYAIVMAMVFLLHLPKIAPSLRKQSFTGEITQGFKYAMTNKAVRALILMGIFQSLFIQPYLQTLLVIFSKDVFHAGSQGLGLLLGATGVGSAVGVLFMASLNRIEKRGLVQLVALGAFGICAVLFPFAQSLWLGLVIMVVAGIFQVLFLTTNQALVMLAVPGKLMGRVSGILALQQGLLPIGALLSGFMRDLVGLKETAISMGLVCICSALLIAVLSPRVRNLGPATAMQAQEEAESAMGAFS